ncbi:MAG: hypothetical protein APF84_15175 [Gracilibacter sp. BRH_c7a]|nr:MAG: hypothetical protein APF84_15175 [Gracilibacter sp. BRH_c7a]
MSNNYVLNQHSITEPQQEISILDRADVVIGGGGVAGLGAAIASAREGVKTILIETNGFLGGVATSNMMQALCGCRGMSGIMEELVDRMNKKGGAPKWDYQERLEKMKDGYVNETITFDIECFKETALEMCLEAGVVLYLYTRVCKPIVNNNTVVGVIVESKGGRQAILAERVVDCTGDGDIAYRAGAPYSVGRDSDNKMRPFALLFRVGGLDVKKILEYVEQHPNEWQPQHKNNHTHQIGDDSVINRLSGFFDLVNKAKANNDLYEWIHYLRFEAVYIDKGIALCNTSRIYYLDGTNPQDLTKGEILGRNQINKIIKFIKKYLPGGENAFLIDVAPSIGVRETRRFVGEYFLTEEDVYSGKDFDDCFMTLERKLPRYEDKDTLDIHPPVPIEGAPEDLYERDQKKVLQVLQKLRFSYRMLLPQKIDCLLFAGRTMSTTHTIESFSRLMPFCMRMGQVAGTAAAVSVREKVSPKELDFSLLKQALIRQGYTKF